MALNYSRNVITEIGRAITTTSRYCLGRQVGDRHKGRLFLFLFLSHTHIHTLTAETFFRTLVEIRDGLPNLRLSGKLSSSNMHQNF